MCVAPLETEMLGERLDREVVRWPLRRFEHHIKIEIDGARGIEESFKIGFRANMRVFRAELSVDRPFIFRVVIDDAGLRLLHVRPCLCERLLLRFPGRIVREKGYEPLRTVVPAAELDKAVQVATVDPQPNDLVYGKK